MEVGRCVIIHYDPLTPKYEGTDAMIIEAKPDLGHVQMFKLERYDGTTAWYSENYIKNYIDLYDEIEDDLPELPICKCPMRTLMMKGCQCGGI